MPDQVNVHEAKTHLSKLLARVAAGEEIVIARNGTPIARLVKERVDPRPSLIGAFRGQIWIADDFDEEDEELTRLFEGDAE